VQIVYFVCDVSPHDISNEKAEEGTVDGVEEIVSGDVGTFSIGMQHSFEVKRQTQFFFLVVDKGSGMTPAKVGRLVKLLSFADEILPFLL
jgi:hypothetical protein